MGIFGQDLFSEGFDSANAYYVLNDNGMFSLTEYKVLKNQSKNFVKCSKLLYNGKIKLLYFSSNYKSLKNMIASIDVDTFLMLIANLLNAIIDIRQNGFLNCNNLDLSFDKIFIDTKTYEVDFIYLPVNNDESSSLAFENDLRANTIKLITSMPFSDERIPRICGYLSNGTIGLNQVYNAVCSEMGGNGKARVQPKPEVRKFSSQPVMRFYSVNPSDNVMFNISTAEFVIGKNPSAVNGVISFNNAISRKHCKITFQNGSYYLTDLGSANGTFINNSALVKGRAYPLNGGDTVKLANSSFKVDF